MKKNIKPLNIYSLLTALVVIIAACGNGEDAPATTEETSDDIRTIEIIGTDNMRYVVASEQEGLVTGSQVGDDYELEQILASPGEELRIVLRSRSDLPGTAMSHNFALLELDTDVEEFANTSITAPDNDYISPDFEDQLIASTSMLAGGETETIEFTVPEETGEYDYACTFPGHFAAGMNGQLVVE